MDTLKIEWLRYKKGSVLHAVRLGYDGKYMVCDAQYTQCGSRYTNYLNPDNLSESDLPKCKKCLRATGTT